MSARDGALGPGPRARLLTPRGPAAIAVVEVAGPGAAAAIVRVFRRRSGRAAAPDRRVTLGTIGVAELADEVVLVPVDEDRFEVCGHGGPGTVARVLSALREAGVETAEPEAPPLVARARTWLGVRVASWVEEGLLAPDDPLVGPLLEPRRVVLAGAPNAGKSSLFNALLERERAIVSSIAGTTRDVIEEETAFAGVPLILCDAAGTSSSSSSVSNIDEQAAEKARAAAADADLVVRCVDGSRSLENESENENENENENEKTLLVVTKCDLPPAFDPPHGALRVSARTAEGMDALALAIATRLLGRDPRDVWRPV